jgi:glucuronokinase
MICESVSYARAGLVGNPSDGYFGKTISFTMRDFAAKVSLYESAELEIVPSLQDRFKYGSLHELADDVHKMGYYGGIRLMKAAIRRFSIYCDEHGVSLPARNFTIRYRSTIPRRLGMAGSSALVSATIKCLMEFYDVEIPKPILPNIILSAEADELGISAGLQDRVVQVFQGLVYMDFDKNLIEARGYGAYENLDPALLPNVYIAYRDSLSEGSEVVHNTIRQRWNAGDPEVVQAMRDFAEYTDRVKELLVAGRGAEIGKWLDKNFDRRRSITAIDPAHLELIERARSAGASAKFSGSGGCIVGTYEDEEMFTALLKAFEGTDTVVMKPTITE